MTKLKRPTHPTSIHWCTESEIHLRGKIWATLIKATAARATFRSRLLNRLPTLKAILQGWFIIGSANQPLKNIKKKKRQKKIRGGGSPNKHSQATSCFRRHKETSRGEKHYLKLQRSHNVLKGTTPSGTADLFLSRRCEQVARSIFSTFRLLTCTQLDSV